MRNIILLILLSFVSLQARSLNLATGDYSSSHPYIEVEGQVKPSIEILKREYLRRKVTQGHIAILKGMYVDGMERFTEALQLAQANNDSLYTGIAKTYIAYTNCLVGNYQDGLAYAIDAKNSFGNEISPEAKLWSEVCLGSAHYLNNNRAVAKKILGKTIETVESENLNFPFIIFSYVNLASIKIIENNISEATDLLHKAIKDPSNIYSRALITSYYKLGRIYRCQGDSTTSSYYFSKALELSKREEDKSYLAEIYKVFAKEYMEKGNYELASKYYFLTDSISTNVIDSKVSQKVQQIVIDYHKNLELKKTEIKKQEAIIEKLMLQEKSSKLQASVFFLLFFGTCSFTVFFYYRRKNFLKLSQLKYEIAKSKEELLNQYIAGQEEERNRIARDLHDGIGSQLAVLKMQLSHLQNQDHSALSPPLLLCDEIYSGLRNVAFNLMPRTLIREGLVSALEELTCKLEKNTDIKFYFNNYGVESRLSSEIESALFRISQEITANIVKHSKAKNANIDIASDYNNVGLTITWDGEGFDPKLLEHSKGFGWKNINTRLNQVSGNIMIDSSKEKDFTVVMVEIPVKMKRNYGKAS